MSNPVIVSYARTALGKSFRGAFNDTEAPVLGGHVVKSAITRAQLEAGDIDDVIMGCAAQQGTQGYNIGRLSAYTAGLGEAVPGMAVDRMCASGLVSIGLAANAIRAGDARVVVAGGVESISLTQNTHKNSFRAQSLAVKAVVPTAYIQMIETAEIVSARYQVSRALQDEYALLSQQRTHQAQQAGLLREEIVPLEVSQQLFDKEGQATEKQLRVVDKDECNRGDTTLESLSQLKPVWKNGQWVPMGQFITAGNASQLSDGAAAVVVMDAHVARDRGLSPMGVFHGMVVAGCKADEMGIGPVFAVPKLLKRFGLRIGDIDLFEINEAFACQVLYCATTLGIPLDRLNVNGGAISIGHPFGMSGTRMAGHVLMEGRRRKARWAIVSMCIGGGMGAAGLFEIPQC